MQFIRQSTDADCIYLGSRLRKQDQVECVALGHNSYNALKIGLDISSTCNTILDPVNLLPMAMYGISKGDYGFGLIWMLCSPEIEKHPKTFLRGSVDALQDLWDTCEYPALYNYTHTGNDLHHRWLRWLGFTFLRKVEAKPSLYFYEFIKLRKEPNV